MDTIFDPMDLLQLDVGDTVYSHVVGHWAEYKLTEKPIAKINSHNKNIIVVKGESVPMSEKDIVIEKGPSPNKDIIIHTTGVEKLNMVLLNLPMRHPISLSPPLSRPIAGQTSEFTMVFDQD